MSNPILRSELDAEDQSSARINARMLWLVTTIYPAWSVYLHFLHPTEYDEPLGRCLVGLFAFGLWVMLKAQPRRLKHAALFNLFALLALNGHFHWLIHQSALSDVYIFGSAVVAAATAVMFDRTRYFLVYASVSTALSIAVTAAHFGSTPKASLFLVMVVTIKTVVYISLSARFSALQHLKEAREANLEMKKLLLERELDQTKLESDQYRQLSMHDPITGLPNRLYFDRQLRLAMDRYYQEGIPFALLFIDLDGFKAVNDGHGHEAGDRVLSAAAQRIRSALRRSDVVARLGGDEFVAILAGIDDRATIDKITDVVVEAVSAPIDIPGTRCQIGASVGVAICPQDGDRCEEILRNADKNMYEVKRQRKQPLLRAA